MGSVHWVVSDEKYWQLVTFETFQLDKSWLKDFELENILYILVTLLNSQLDKSWLKDFEK